MNATTTTDGHPDVLDGIGLPTKRDEAWRYAPHRLLSELTFGPPSGTPHDLMVDLDDRLPVLGGPRIVVVNGLVDPDRSHLTASREQGHLSAVEVFTRPSDGGAQGDPEVEIVDAYMALNSRTAPAGQSSTWLTMPLAAPIHVVDVAVPGDDREHVV